MNRAKIAHTMTVGNRYGFPRSPRNSNAFPDRRNRGLHSSINFAIVGLLGALLFPVLWVCDIEVSLALPLAVLLALTGDRFVDLILHGGRRDVLAPTVLVAFYFLLYFGLRGVYVEMTPFADTRSGLTPYEDYLPIALWCASLGYICFSFGFSSSSERHLEAALPKFRLSWPRKVPTIRILLIVVIGFGSMMYLFSLGLVVGEYRSLDVIAHPPPGWAVLLEKLLYIGWVAICVCLVLPQRIVGRRAGWPLLFISMALLLARVGITGSKEALIQPILQAVIVFHYLKRRFRAWELAAFALPVILLAFGAVNFYRFVIVGELGGSPKSVGDVVSRVSSASDYLSSGQSSGQMSALDQMMMRQAGVDSLALVMKYTPDPNPFALGSDLLNVPLSFIPRQLWADKPMANVGHRFETQYMGMPADYIGFSSIHLISDLYRNFYYFGVVGGLFLIGVLVRFVYRFLEPASQNGTGVFIYAILFPTTGRFFEGDLVNAVTETTKICLLAFMTAWFLGARFRKVSSGKRRSFSNRPRPVPELQSISAGDFHGQVIHAD